MYGWRGRLGIVMPFNNTIVEPELSAHLPEGMSLHGARVVPRTGDTIPEQTEAMSQTIPWALEGLRGKVNIFGYACMTSSLVKATAWHEVYADQTGDVPFLPAGECMVAALNHVGAKRLGVFSPFFDDIAGLVPDWFDQRGFEVVHNVNMPFTPDQVISKRSADLFQSISGAMTGPDIDAVAILATDLETFSSVNALEADLGIPVVSTNLALLWAMLDTLGIRGSSAPGRLFEDELN